MRTRTRITLWAMMGCQMAAWAWMQSRGGKLGDWQYLQFCALFLIGQIGAAIECRKGRAWGTMVVQIYFFIFTLVGAVVRWQRM